MKKKFIPLILILFALILIAIILFENQIYNINRRPPIAKEHKRVLLNLAQDAKENGDLPISAVLLNDYTIIGEGYDTIERDTDLTGHAEINALKSAIKNMGYQNFMRTDRENFILVSTNDPCEMCKGTLKYYGIKYIYFIREQSLTKSMTENFNEFIYQVNKKKLDTEDFLNSVK